MKTIKISSLFIVFLLFFNCKNDKSTLTKEVLKSEDSLIETQREHSQNAQIQDSLVKVTPKTTISEEDNFSSTKKSKLIAQKNSDLFLYQFNLIDGEKFVTTNDSELIDFKKQKIIEQEDSHTYLFQDLTFNLKYIESGYFNFVIDNLEYKTSATFDMGEIFVNNFRNLDEHIFIVSLEDYSSSLYFIYLLSSKELYYAGYLNVEETKAEEKGLKKKSFTVSKSKDGIIVETFIDGILLGKTSFDRFNKISQVER